MIYFVTIAGFLGAWLLVFGPVFQAGIELTEEKVDREALEATTSGVAPPPHVSRWWLFLPPVYYLKHRRVSQAYRDATFAELSTEQRTWFVGFMSKANAWIYVAGGAFFLAIKESYELIELLEWPIVVFWVVIVVLPIAAIANASLNITRGEKMKDPAAFAQRLAEREHLKADRKATRNPS